MALDFFTGFDHYAAADLARGRFTSVQNAQISTTTFRNGTQALNLSTGASAFVKKTGLSNAATRVLGFAFRSSDVTAEGRIFAVLSDGDPGTSANGQVGLGLTTAGSLQVRRGVAIGSLLSVGTQLGSNSTNVLSSATWYFIELVVTVDNSVGTVEVFVNGSKTGWIDLTGQDTQNTANAYANAFGLSGRNSGGHHIDDLYCLSGAGGVRTTRLGDVKAIPKLAQADSVSGAGDLNDSTPSSGTDRGAMVDDATPDGDSTYNAFTAAGQKDSYKHVALGASGTVFGAQSLQFLTKSDAGVCEAQVGFRVNGTNYEGSADFPSEGSYAYVAHLTEQNPETAANWLVAALDAAQSLVHRTV